MKNVIFSLALLITIISGCVLTLSYTRKTTIEILDTLDLCEEAVYNEDWSAAMDRVYLATSLWHHYRPLYSTFLRHNELTEITDRLSRITILVSEKKSDDFLVENGALCELIDYVANFDKPTLENVF